MMQNEIRLLRAGIIITHRCTLQCKLCGSCSPYYYPKLHFSKEQIEKTIERFFWTVDFVGDLSFSGGEPLLHDDLAFFLEKVRKYEAQYQRLLVLTNGTLLPNDVLLNAMQACGEKFQVNISNYGIDKSKRCEELKLCLTEAGIKFREIIQHGDNPYCDGWVDLSDNAQRYFNEEDIIEHSQSCMKQTGGQCYIITGGEMHNCARSFRRKYLGIISPPIDEYVDFWDDTKTVEDYRKTVLDMLEKPYKTSCAYCAGFRKDATRFVPAEQLTNEEVAAIKAGAKSFAEVCGRLNKG